MRLLLVCILLLHEYTIVIAQDTEYDQPDKADSIWVAKADTSELSKIYRKNDRSLLDSLVFIYHATQITKDSIELERLNKKKIDLEKIRAINARQFILDHSSHLLSLDLLLDLVVNYSAQGQWYPFSVADLQQLYAQLDVSLQNTYSGKRTNGWLKKLNAVSVGNIAPDFSLPSSNGETVHLSSYRGRYVFLDFWASWCTPCRAENPHVLDAYNIYHKKEFDVFAVSLDMDERDWHKAIQEDGLPWTQVSDLKLPNAAALKYGVKAVPSNFLIGPDGTILARNLRGKDLKKKLSELLDK